jgi:acyl carrier protein
MEINEITSKIEEILYFFITDEVNIFNDSLLKEDLALDSLSLVNLVLTLNDDFNINIKSEEISEENFYSVKTLSNFISKKLVN